MGDGTDRDRAAILRVIEEETAAYFNKDYDAWSRCWVHTPRVRRWGWMPANGMTLHEGWDQESAAMWQSMERFPEPNASAPAIRRDRVNMWIGADVAWVTFDQHAPETGDPFDVAGLQHNLRIMEKHEAEWKIACITVLQPFPEKADYPLVRVDEHATVLWTNRHAREQLRNHKGLIVSGGRLRARNRPAQKGLQAAIRWAADVVELAERQAAARGALAVNLGDDDAASAQICWVISDSGMVLVSFDDPATMQRRLSAAAIVFGLSPGQLRLAGLIVDGCDLAAAAERLGITVNTARTHLQRMFDKTGVRSQPALVRVLLSAVAPVA